MDFANAFENADISYVCIYYYIVVFSSFFLVYYFGHNKCWSTESIKRRGWDSWALAQSPVTRNSVKKKSEKNKMSGGDLAAALSPAYSIMKGKGPASALAGAGLGGILTMPFAKKQRDRRKKRNKKRKE